MLRVYYILMTILVVNHQTSAQECKPQSSGYGFTYPQIFTVLNDGPRVIIANKSMASVVMGSCFDPDDIAKEMFEYFEAYGADLSEVKGDPFNKHVNDLFEISTITQDPQKRTLHVVTTTLFENSRFTDTTMYNMIWKIIAKKDLKGSEGSLLAGHRLLFGTYRFLLHNRDFCIKSKSAGPVLIRDVTTGEPILGPRPFHMKLKNEFLGDGEAIGLVIAGEDRAVIRYIMTFPA